MKKNIIISIVFLTLATLSFKAKSQDTIDGINSKDVSVTEDIEVVSNKNVITIIKEAFPRFYALLEKTGFASDIESASAVTIFAPTDAAFDKLINLIGKDAYDEVFNKTYTQDGMQKLKRVLKLHIVPSKTLASDIMSMKTAQLRTKGKPSKEDVIKINETTAVIEADIIGTNGIVRAIDAVIMP